MVFLKGGFYQSLNTRTDKLIAVIGSTGLATAQQLNRVGHTVTIFERDDAIEGSLRYRIPNFKLEKEIIDMHRGQSLIVWAISEGREAARQVDFFLMGQTNLPAKGNGDLLGV